MPMREYGCPYGHVTDKYFHTTRLEDTPRIVDCEVCHSFSSLMFSVPNLDTATSMVHAPGAWEGPDGKKWDLQTLHDIRKAEKHYEGTGHNCRFDAWSAEPSNPDALDGFGLPYWSGYDNDSGATVARSLPIRED